MPVHATRASRPQYHNPASCLLACRLCSSPAPSKPALLIFFSQRPGSATPATSQTLTRSTCFPPRKLVPNTTQIGSTHESIGPRWVENREVVSTKFGSLLHHYPQLRIR